jgi:uncharacterized membrane protein YdbT with pleckstrin-like domain
MMDDKILMRLQNQTALLVQEELVIKEHEVTLEIGMSKRSIPYERIAQVDLRPGFCTATLTLFSTGGNLSIKGLEKAEAETAKALIDRQVQQSIVRSSVDSNRAPEASVADELRKLADLKANGVLTEEEFQLLKKRLLTLV